MWVRGLKLICKYKIKKQSVAPYVGAWIETVNTIDGNSVLLSHPMWVRGLKHATFEEPQLDGGRTLCGCVD